ncbi:MAG: GIY-YIG nuclease family protein [Candidatus Moranbacteria bacterium]|nr:GIY-YIG nuclease family protein [Candidatus Moranbacteria bacterium]
MFTVYVLRSLKNSKRYVGYTSKDSLERLREHNCGCNKWARENKPFRLIYTEKYEIKKEAIRGENFLKSGRGRKWLDENIDNKISKAPR